MRIEEYDKETQCIIRESMKEDSTAKYEQIEPSYVLDHKKQFGQDISFKGLLTEDGKRTFLIQVSLVSVLNDTNELQTKVFYFFL